MRELAGLLEKTDLAVGAASGVIDQSIVESLRESSRLVRARLDFPDDLVIVGLAGGTGSGKSSLLNAIAGEEIADVGGVRPTTDQPLAVAEGRQLDLVATYLREVGITGLVEAQVGEGFCLIDLPDTDSVEVDHRLRVDALLPALDAVVWVVDPEKYRDASLHHGFIRPMADQARQFIFVFNQVDRVAGGSRPQVLADFETALREDGISEPVVVATAAAPGTGPPEGIRELVAALKKISPESVIDRALTRIEQAAARILDAAGEGGLGFEEKSSDVISRATTLIESGDLDAATDELAGFAANLSEEAGGLSRARVATVASVAPTAVQSSYEQASGADDRGEVISRSLHSHFVEPLRDVLRLRSDAVAAATDLSLSVAAFRSRSP